MNAISNWWTSPEGTMQRLKFPDGAIETAEALAENDRIVSRDFTIPWNRVSRHYKTLTKSAHRRQYKKQLDKYEKWYGTGHRNVDAWIDWLRTPLHKD